MNKQTVIKVTIDWGEDADETMVDAEDTANQIRETVCAIEVQSCSVTTKIEREI